MLSAKDIMHPRLSVPAKESGESLVNRMLCIYPGLPVVNENDEVIGVVTEHDIFDAVKEHRTIHEFSAESIMSCGHIEHEGVCGEPVTVTRDTSIDEVVNIMHSKHLSILPVVENATSRKLVGLISRKNIINALSEKHFWPEYEFQKRV